MITPRIALIKARYRSDFVTPPLALGYLASHMKANGVEPLIVDGLREDLDPGQILDRLREHNITMAGLTCLSAFYTQTVELARLLKSAGIRVVIGGIHPTFLPARTLAESGADCVVCGEGEVALLELVRNGFDPAGIRGVYTAANAPCEGAPIKKAEHVEDLDALPFPDWDQLDPRLYPRAAHVNIVKNFPIGVITSTRGCPYDCTFCASPAFYGRRIRFRSPGNVVAEIELLVRRYGVREIHFEDDNLTLKRSHVESICRLLLEKNLSISWACPNGIRPDRVDEELIKLMARSGCYYFAFGIESANEQILRNIKKRESLEKTRRAIQWARKHGITCQGFFLLGLPGETRQSMEESIRFACDSDLERAQFFILDVLPGSELWTSLKGRFKPDWNKLSQKVPEWIPDGLTLSDIQRAQTRGFRKFYLRPGVLLRILRNIKWSQIKLLLARIREYRIS